MTARDPHPLAETAAPGRRSNRPSGSGCSTPTTGGDLEDEAQWREANRGLEEACPGRLQLGLDWRAEVRWCHAVNEWYRQHPGADHRFEDLLERRRRRLAGGGAGRTGLD